MADLIDVEEESKRLQKEIGKRSEELNQVRGKLSNANFVDCAPVEVVEKEKAKEQEISSAVEKLQAQLERIKAL